MSCSCWDCDRSESRFTSTVPPPTSMDESLCGAKAALSTRRKVQKVRTSIAELPSRCWRLDESREERLSEFLRDSSGRRHWIWTVALLHVARDQVIEREDSRTEDHHQQRRKQEGVGIRCIEFSGL